MVADDRHDRLIDALLWELHGETASPDLRARVLAAAFPTRRRAMRRALAAAAVLLAAVVGWMALRGRYPRPRAEGDFTLIREGAAVDPASSLRRGDRLERLPQMAEAAIRMTASPGFGSGSGSSLTSALLFPAKTTPSIASFFLWLDPI